MSVPQDRIRVASNTTSMGYQQSAFVMDEPSQGRINSPRKVVKPCLVPLGGSGRILTLNVPLIEI